MKPLDYYCGVENHNILWFCVVLFATNGNLRIGLFGLSNSGEIDSKESYAVEVCS